VLQNPLSLSISNWYRTGEIVNGFLVCLFIIFAILIKFSVIWCRSVFILVEEGTHVHYTMNLGRDHRPSACKLTRFSHILISTSRIRTDTACLQYEIILLTFCIKQEYQRKSKEWELQRYSLQKQIVASDSKIKVVPRMCGLIKVIISDHPLFFCCHTIFTSSRTYSVTHWCRDILCWIAKSFTRVRLRLDTNWLL
jgi:hypothetical protein